MDSDGESLGDVESETERGTSQAGPAFLQTSSQQLDGQALPGAQLGSSGSEYESEIEEQHPRFQGVDSTYRSYIRHEQALLDSLTKQDNANLGVHLYNAHKWKQQFYDAKLNDRSNAARSKAFWLRSDDDGKEPWQPTSDWTAWPLLPEQLNEGESGWSDSGMINSSVRRPLSNLRAEIEGFMLDRAKGQSRARTWMSHPSVAHDIVQSTTATKGEPRAASEGAQSVVSEPQSTADSRTEEMPSIIDDDDVAGSLVNPMVNDITSKLDTLLLALQVNRKGHRLAETYSRPSSSRSALRTPVDLSPAPDVSARSGQRTTQYGLRDWSEILGIAALAGWDAEVIKRAHERCSELFGEDMEFRSFPDPLPTTATLPQDYKQEKIPISAYTSEDDVLEHDVVAKRTRQQSAIPLTHYFCPFDTCARSEVSFDKAWRWREHLKRKHKLVDQQVGDLERERHAESDDQTQESEPDPRESTSFACPYDTCLRHMQGYDIRWRLHEHLKKSHGHTLEEARDLVQSAGEQSSTP